MPFHPIKFVPAQNANPEPARTTRPEVTAAAPARTTRPEITAAARAQLAAIIAARNTRNVAPRLALPQPASAELINNNNNNNNNNVTSRDNLRAAVNGGRNNHNVALSEHENQLASVNGGVTSNVACGALSAARTHGQNGSAAGLVPNAARNARGLINNENVNLPQNEPEHPPPPYSRRDPTPYTFPIPCYFYRVMRLNNEGHLRRTYIAAANASFGENNTGKLISKLSPQAVGTLTSVMARMDITDNRERQGDGKYYFWTLASLDIIDEDNFTAGLVRYARNR